MHYICKLYERLCLFFSSLICTLLLNDCGNSNDSYFISVRTTRVEYDQQVKKYYEVT